jgi:benzylsuccinate CoA-transferase BbsF subunit
VAFAPLEGIRVVDFSWNVAGPTSTKVLAALGADVIKIEWPGRPDPGRAFSFSPVTPGIFDSGGFFADLNLGKRSFTVDPTDPAGKALVEELIAASDAVVESYSARVMPKWGLGYDRLRELNPSIVYLSVSGFGHTGPHASYVSYGPTAQAVSGITYASGAPGEQPAGWGYSYLDVMTGYQAAYAAVVALERRRRTGVGARIDLSQLETGASLLGPLLSSAAHLESSRGAFPPGNRAVSPEGAPGYRYESGAPYGVYPTRRADADDTDAYIAITVLTDDQWAALRAELGDPSWADGLDAAAARIAAQDLLDERIAVWTAGAEKFELADRLQAAGVPAAAMESGRDRVDNDPSLRAREVMQPVEHPFVGPHRMASIPVVVDGTPLEIHRRWPLMGSGTDDILRDVLGYDDDRIAALRAAGTTWPVGVPRADKAEELTR